MAQILISRHPNHSVHTTRVMAWIDGQDPEPSLFHGGGLPWEQAKCVWIFMFFLRAIGRLICR